MQSVHGIDWLTMSKTLFIFDNMKGKEVIGFAYTDGARIFCVALISAITDNRLAFLAGHYLCTASPDYHEG